MFKNLATIVEVFGDRVLSLVGLRPMCKHRTLSSPLVVGDRRHILVPGSYIGRRLAARLSYEARLSYDGRSAAFKRLP